jgi:Flp pilus assembly protein TadB
MKNNTEQKVKTAFSKIDEAIDSKSPNAATIAMLLAVKNKEYQNKLKRELLIFILTASVIVGILILVLVKAPIVYILIQIFGLAIVPLYVFFERKERYREET